MLDGREDVRAVHVLPGVLPVQRRLLVDLPGRHEVVQEADHLGVGGGPGNRRLARRV